MCPALPPRRHPQGRSLPSPPCLAGPSSITVPSESLDETTCSRNIWNHFLADLTRVVDLAACAVARCRSTAKLQVSQRQGVVQLSEMEGLAMQLQRYSIDETDCRLQVLVSQLMSSFLYWPFCIGMIALQGIASHKRPRYPTASKAIPHLARQYNELLVQLDLFHELHLTYSRLDLTFHSAHCWSSSNLSAQPSQYGHATSADGWTTTSASARPSRPYRPSGCGWSLSERLRTSSRSRGRVQRCTRRSVFLEQSSESINQHR